MVIDSDVGLGISADGVILLSGSTYSTDAMSSAGAYQPTISGPQDAFYAKFDLTGNGYMVLLRWAYVRMDHEYYHG